MAAINIPHICGWPTTTTPSGYQHAQQQQALIPARWCGSFSFKNHNPLEITWTNAQGVRMGAHMVRFALIPDTAIITFHLVNSNQDVTGLWHDSCNMAAQLPAIPPLAEFRITSATTNQVIQPLAACPLGYVIPWRDNYDIEVAGQLWERLIVQISIGRSAMLTSLVCHNYSH